MQPTMTPKDRLNDDDKNTLLSCILKSRHDRCGIRLTSRSMHMTEAPSIQAFRCVSSILQRPVVLLCSPIPLSAVMIHPRVSLSSPVASIAMSHGYTGLALHGRSLHNLNTASSNGQALRSSAMFSQQHSMLVSWPFEQNDRTISLYTAVDKAKMP